MYSMHGGRASENAGICLVQAVVASANADLFYVGLVRRRRFSDKS